MSIFTKVPQVAYQGLDPKNKVALTNTLFVVLGMQSLPGWFRVEVEVLGQYLGSARPFVVIGKPDSFVSSKVLEMTKVQETTFRTTAYVEAGFEISINFTDSFLLCYPPKVLFTAISKRQSFVNRALIIAQDKDYWRGFSNGLRSPSEKGLRGALEVACRSVFRRIRKGEPSGGLERIKAVASDFDRYQRWLLVHQGDLIAVEQGSNMAGLSETVSSRDDGSGATPVGLVLDGRACTSDEVLLTLSSIFSQRVSNLAIVVVFKEGDYNTWKRQIAIMSSLYGFGGTVVLVDFRVMANKDLSTLIDETPMPDAGHHSERFWCFLEGGTLLGLDLLTVLDAEIKKGFSPKVVYFDHDLVARNGIHHSPHLKAFFDPDLWYASNYIGRGTFVSGVLLGTLEMSLAESLSQGAIDRACLFLIRSDNCSSIVHVPVVGFHYLDYLNFDASFESNPKIPARFELVERHLQEIFPNVVLKEKKIENATGPLEAKGEISIFEITYEPPLNEPKVSIIIPTRDGIDVLPNCIDSLRSKTIYENFEILIVDNGSLDPRMIDYLDSVSTEDSVRVVSFDGPFNFAKIQNFALSQCDGELVCLLNDDTEVLEGEWLTKMVGLALREDVGVVGARLLYPDRTLQHCGIYLGIGEALSAQGEGVRDFVSISQCVATHEVSAVTGAALLISRSLWMQVGGMDEIHLGVSYNDVDLCMKVRDVGLRVMVEVGAVLIHHESKTRGLDGLDPKKIRRNASERAYMLARWDCLMEDDRFYSPLYSKSVLFDLDIE
ncbi:glycosyltransferase family 2 protein [Acidithrix sp. C25]|uniref:glycosyltransferase family 2 protein n=1 Tax=Acidithrix sp. C25 TaxID=1671482 RepID=UPI00191BB5C0|nr:glycosyltransferase family 2 protein [Acidithrix sp. C25]CAG4931992.1 unnamed protein product [Acidithrix sp. C25]